MDNEGNVFQATTAQYRTRERERKRILVMKNRKVSFPHQCHLYQIKFFIASCIVLYCIYHIKETLY